MNQVEEKQSQFREAFTAKIRAKIASLKREGTVAMSRDNLWQVSVGGLSQLAGAPMGTNAPWVARQVFDEIVSANFSQFANL